MYQLVPKWNLLIWDMEEVHLKVTDQIETSQRHTSCYLNDTDQMRCRKDEPPST